LEATARLRDGKAIPHKLVFVGKRGWNYSDVFAAVERLGLSQDVQFLDYVPDRWLPSIYNLADALVFPSLYEGFGLPVVEAMASGTPVITSPNGALKDIAGDAAVYMEPENVENIAEILYQTLTDSQLLEELRARGLRRAAEFSWEKAAEMTRQLYRQVANGEPGVDSEADAKINTLLKRSEST
jgi:glycosyltransferase involved in cell wall biosynthesis